VGVGAAAASAGEPNLEDLYREVILEHYRSPRNRGRLDGPDTVGVQLQNPTCGDEIELYLALRGGRVQDARFTGRGCSISMASASMMTEALKGRSVEEAVALSRAFKAMLRGEPPDAGLGDLVALAGVAQFPVRVKCATLAWNAMLRALDGGAGPAGDDDGEAADPRGPSVPRRGTAGAERDRAARAAAGGRRRTSGPGRGVSAAAVL
jgi:nitrogen fixation NifU-like protein